MSTNEEVCCSSQRPTQEVNRDIKFADNLGVISNLRGRVRGNSFRLIILIFQIAIGLVFRELEGQACFIVVIVYADKGIAAGE